MSLIMTNVFTLWKNHKCKRMMLHVALRLGYLIKIFVHPQ